jgi:hypothetical protein
MKKNKPLYLVPRVLAIVSIILFSFIYLRPLLWGEAGMSIFSFLLNPAALIFILITIIAWRYESLGGLFYLIGTVWFIVLLFTKDFSLSYYIITLLWFFTGLSFLLSSKFFTKQNMNKIKLGIMKKSTKKLLLKLLLVIIIWIMGVQLNDFGSGLLEVYVFFIGLVLIPIIIIYAYRYINKLDVNILHKVFRFIVWLFIIMLIINAFGLAMYDYPYLYFFLDDIGEILISISPSILIIILLSLMLKVNSSLIPQKDRNKSKLLTLIKKNKELTIAVFAIILCLSVIIGVLTYAQYEIDFIIEMELDLITSPEQSDLYIQNQYTNAYKQVATFGSFIMASAFLLIYSLKKK